MPFYLRGGRPKSMAQGIYWVQRERATGRARASRADAAIRFNERYGRITGQFLSVFLAYADPSGTIRVTEGSKLNLALDRYNELKAWIDQNVDAATNADLSKLATAAKTVLVEIDEREGWPARWDSATRQLLIRDGSLDFS